MTSLHHESLHSDQPIRGEHDGFADERERYLAALHRSEHEPIQQPRIPWPLDMRNPDFHITAYYNDTNYSGSGNAAHLALDIQTPLGTPVTLPVSGRLVSVLGLTPSSLHDNHSRGLADVILLDPQSRLLYRFGHLDSRSLPAELTEDFFDMRSDISVEAGSMIGTVGEFYGEHMKRYGKDGLGEWVDVPPDVAAIYGRSYNHLHFDIARLPTLEPFYPERFTKYAIDPLPRLEQLYGEVQGAADAFE